MAFHPHPLWHLAPPPCHLLPPRQRKSPGTTPWVRPSLLPLRGISGTLEECIFSVSCVYVCEIMAIPLAPLDFASPIHVYILPTHSASPHTNIYTHAHTRTHMHTLKIGMRGKLSVSEPCASTSKSCQKSSTASCRRVACWTGRKRNGPSTAKIP